MPYLLVLQHFPCETLGTIATALESKGITARYVRAFEGEPVPGDLADAVGLVVMGGPMGVYDHGQFPYLGDELHLIERALRDERPILGVCLGSQLLAAAAGGAVTRGKQKELGWHPVRLAPAAREDPLLASAPAQFVAYHWHGDVFDLPAGALALASSEMTEHQAFRLGRNAYGFLFHMEVTARMVGEMVESFADEARAAGVDPAEVLNQSDQYLSRLQEIGGVVFSHWADLVDLEP